MKTCRNCQKELVGKQRAFCSLHCKNVHNVSKHRRETKLKAIEYLGGACARCGYSRCVGALHFHHRNPSEKEFQIGSGNTPSWEKVQKELDKCELLCANCHAEEHG